MCFLLLFPATAEGKVEEEFTVARLYVSKMKSEVKNLASRAAQLEEAQADGSARQGGLEKELSEARLLIGELLSPFFFEISCG